MAKPTRNTTHERIADSIVALINSRPQSPTRAELMAVLAGWKLVGCAANDNRGAPQGPGALGMFAPTKLGLEIIELLPERAEAMWHACHVESGEPDEEAIEGWELGTWSELVTRYKAATSIVDLAIAHRTWRGGEARTVWDDETFCPEHVLADRLCAAILKLAGIDESRLDIEAIWRARGWYREDGDAREPTEEERREALASLQDIDDAA